MPPTEQAERGIATLFLCGIGSFTGLGLANVIASADPKWKDAKFSRYSARIAAVSGLGFTLLGGLVMPAVWIYRMNFSKK